MIKILKKELRMQIARVRTEYSDSTLKALSADIMNRVEAHPAFRSASVVLCYYSIPGEVRTHEFCRKWCRHKRILLPVVAGNELALRDYATPDRMLPGAYGILEPAGDDFTDYDSIDFVLVPGVAFDRKNRRMGHGKGYYDRLLPHLGKAYKAGVCFPFQMVEEVPVDPFDVTLDAVITL